MYSREFETGVFDLGGAASGVEFVAIGSGLGPDLKMLKVPIVAGIDAFRDAMAGFEDKYVLIGGRTSAIRPRDDFFRLI